MKTNEGEEKNEKKQKKKEINEAKKINKESERKKLQRFFLPYPALNPSLKVPT